MHNSVEPRSFLADPASDILEAIIRFYRARIANNNAYLPIRPDYLDFFTYRWNHYSFYLLERLSEDKWYKNDFYRRQYSTFYCLLGGGENDLLHLLLKFDILRVQILEEFPIIKYGNNENVFGGIFASNFYIEHSYVDIENRFRIYEPFCHFHFLCKLRNHPCVSLKRFRKVLWGLEAIVVRGYSYAHPCDKALCLQTFYDFTREPYITSDEIAETVRCIGGQDVTEDIVSLFREIFEEYFPNNPDSYQPRKLQHLCACQIRQSVLDAGRHPDEVEKLLFPKSLKSLIATKKRSLDYPDDDIPLLKIEKNVPSRCDARAGDPIEIIRSRAKRFKEEWWLKM